MPVQEIFDFPWLLCRPGTKYFFPPSTLFQFLCPIAQQAGQEAELGRCLLVCVSDQNQGISMGRAFSLTGLKADCYLTQVSWATNR